MADKEKKEKKGGMMKMIIIGLPLFIIQAVAVYFVTANVLLSRFEAENEVNIEQSNENGTSEEEETGPDLAELGKNIYPIEDIIVNPAGTDGKKLLLASLGFDVAPAEAMKEFEAKEILVKDIIISIMSKKTLSFLKQNSYKDTLRAEIISSLQEFLPEVTINRIYFSKYIIQ